jgi:hypothetical protein
VRSGHNKHVQDQRAGVRHETRSLDSEIGIVDTLSLSTTAGEYLC